MKTIRVLAAMLALAVGLGGFSQATFVSSHDVVANGDGGKTGVGG
jgi:hypothetical protein